MSDFEYVKDAMHRGKPTLREKRAFDNIQKLVSSNELQQLRTEIAECAQQLGTIDGLGMYPEASRLYKRLKRLSCEDTKVKGKDKKCS